MTNVSNLMLLLMSSNRMCYGMMLFDALYISPLLSILKSVQGSLQSIKPAIDARISTITARGSFEETQLFYW